MANDDYSERLRLICRDRKIRPGHLARLAGVDKGAASRWLKIGDGRTTPRDKERIVALIGMTMLEFWAVDLDRLRERLEEREKPEAA